MILRPFALAVLFAAWLTAGCSRPQFSESNKVPTSASPAPVLPAWGRQLEGRQLASYRKAAAGGCQGFVDAVLFRYAGSPSGVEIAGWGWDLAAKRPFDKVLITSGGTIVGAGTGGAERPDVPKALPAITSPKTGWTAVVHKDSGGVQAWGVSESTVCALGQLDVK